MAPRVSMQFLSRKKKERRKIELLGGAVFTVTLLVATAAFFASGFQQYALRNPQVAAVVSSVLVELANKDRAENGLGALAVNHALVEIAQAKANDMAKKGYFAHTSPEGIDPWYWFRKVGYDYMNAGENLAVNFSDSSDVERAWMDSPTHRDNILSDTYTEIGIAIAEGEYEGRPATFVVQMFGSPADAPRPTAARIESAAIEPEEESEAQVLGVTATTGSRAAEEKIAQEIPSWGYVAAFPRETLRIIYYILGFIVLVALAIDTGFEIRWHHLRHARRAGIALATMSILFVAADYLFFAEPVLALLSG